ncbi:MAG TPA: hypothetical protein VL688_05100 [Verrucomicrobiae bacterium]|nr:hypothetical protein [Verrucomicrobiae bacterium]
MEIKFFICAFLGITIFAMFLAALLAEQDSESRDMRPGGIRNDADQDLLHTLPFKSRG